MQSSNDPLTIINPKLWKFVLEAIRYLKIIA